MSLIDEIRAMSPEERKEAKQLLQETENQSIEARSLGECMHGPDWDPRTGRYKNDGLTPEEIYVRDHPLILRQYGYSESYAEWGKPQKTIYWSKREVDAYNEDLKKQWLEEARKHFPNINFQIQVNNE